LSEKKRTKKKQEDETIQIGHSSGIFSHTEEFLRRVLGELPTDPIQDLGDSSCDCGCGTHSHNEKGETIHDPQEVKEYIKKRYSNLVTQSSNSCCGPSASCGSSVDTGVFEIAMKDKKNFVENLGYTEVELTDLPDDVTNAAFGCGNPTAIAELLPGEIVLDLGSGAGIDVFLAAKKVGPTGKVIGLDMTPAMIEKATKNAEKMGLFNVEFKLGEMEAIPLVDESIDVVISNCVINLSPDKAQVFRQIFRVLKSGGRIAVSDLVLNGELPDFIKRDFEAWAGCIAGALPEIEYLQNIRDAGFVNITIDSKRSAMELYYTIKESPELIKRIQDEAGCTPEELLNRIVSIKVKAIKPKNNKRY